MSPAGGPGADPAEAPGAGAGAGAAYGPGVGPAEGPGAGPAYGPGVGPAEGPGGAPGPGPAGAPDAVVDGLDGGPDGRVGFGPGGGPVPAGGASGIASVRPVSSVLSPAPLTGSLPYACISSGDTFSPVPLAAGGRDPLHAPRRHRPSPVATGLPPPLHRSPPRVSVPGPRPLGGSPYLRPGTVRPGGGGEARPVFLTLVLRHGERTRGALRSTGVGKTPGEDCAEHQRTGPSKSTDLGHGFTGAIGADHTGTPRHARARRHIAAPFHRIDA